MQDAEGKTFGVLGKRIARGWAGHLEEDIQAPSSARGLNLLRGALESGRWRATISCAAPLLAEAPPAPGIVSTAARIWILDTGRRCARDD